MHSFQYDPTHGLLSVRGELTIYQIGEAVEALRCAYEEGQLQAINLAEVTELDTTGLQWLLLAKQLPKPEGAPLQLLNCSQPVQEVFALAGCAQHLSGKPEVGSAL